MAKLEALRSVYSFANIALSHVRFSEQACKVITVVTPKIYSLICVVSSSSKVKFVMIGTKC